MDKFDVGKFAKRVFWVVCAAGVGVGSFAATVPNVEWDNLNVAVPVLAAAAWGAVRAGIGWYNKSRPSYARLKKVLVVPLVVGALAMGGCATKAKINFVDADGTGFDAVSKAGPFGEIDTTNQNMLYEWDGEGGKIVVGQDAVGLSNAGQVEAFRAGADAVTAVLPSVVQALAGIPGLFGETGPATPGFQDVIRGTIQEEIAARLSEWLGTLEIPVLDLTP